MSYVVVISGMNMHTQRMTFWCSVLNTEPVVIYTAQLTRTGPLGAARFIAEDLRDVPAVFLVARWWSLAPAGAVDCLVQAYRAHIARFPKHHFLFLCNDTLELQIAAAADIPAVLGPTNALVDENEYAVDAGVELQYDSIYVAQMLPYKNHFLCQELQSPAFVYHNVGAVDPRYFDYIKLLNPSAIYLNHVTGAYRQLTPSQVAAAMNAAGAGLCLSWVEGGMYASMEYMLCGRPVVTVPSIGGRELFYCDEYWIRADWNPRAIRLAVDEIVRRRIPPEQIRADIVAKLRIRRVALYEEIDKFIRARTGYPGIAWDRVFFNKLLRMHDVASLREAIARH